MENKFIFILGNNPKISVAEIETIYPKLSIISNSDVYLIGEIKDLDCKEAMHMLGGTIKVAELISDEIDKDKIIDIIKKNKGESKVKFGFSFYGLKPTEIGMEIKRELKEAGVSSRLVVSREKALSAVIVKKEKVTDFIILPNAIGKTCAVQEFEEYGKRDYGRPKSDALSGMLPPKLAKIMVNLSSCDKQETILDPFCGSGTLPMEAIALGYKNIISSDISDKAVSDTKLNMDWLTSELKLTDVNYQIHNLDVRKLSKKIKPSSIDAVATEPYLGPPIKGNESEKQILKTVKELEKLYISAFEEFKLVLKPGGKIVIVIPSWHIKKVFKLDIEREIKKLGFNRKDSDDLVYKREGQKVWRNITIWEKVSKK